MFSFPHTCRLEETKEELEEFQISSHELENELETQLEQCDSKNKELMADKAKLEHECAALRVCIIMDISEQKHYLFCVYVMHMIHCAC